MNFNELQSLQIGGMQYVLSAGVEKVVLFEKSAHYKCTTPFLGHSKFIEVHSSLSKKERFFGQNGENSPERKGIMGFSFIYSYFLMNIMNTYVLVGDKVAILPCGRNKEIEPEVIFPGKKKHVL